jgi:hypothetical protein
MEVRRSSRENSPSTGAVYILCITADIPVLQGYFPDFFTFYKSRNKNPSKSHGMIYCGKVSLLPRDKLH